MIKSKKVAWVEIVTTDLKRPNKVDIVDTFDIFPKNKLKFGDFFSKDQSFVEARKHDRWQVWFRHTLPMNIIDSTKQFQSLEVCENSNKIKRLSCKPKINLKKSAPDY